MCNKNMSCKTRVVFFGQPNRHFPLLLKHILPYYKNYEIIWNHINIYNKPYKFNFVSHTLDKVSRLSVINTRKANLISGVLHPEYGALLKPSFSFTVLSHPVDRIYQFVKLLNMISKFDKQYKELLVLLKLYNTDSKLSLKEFIDNMLYYNFYRGVFSDHIFLLPKNITCLVDFVGIAEEEKKTKSVLQHKLNIDFSTFTFNDRKKVISNYRLKEITKELESEIEEYHLIKNNLIKDF